MYPNGIKAYKEFRALHNITQIINTPTKITEHASTLLDHILTNTAEEVSELGVLDLGLSGHLFILLHKTKFVTNTKN